IRDRNVTGVQTCALPICSQLVPLFLIILLQDYCSFLCSSAKQIELNLFGVWVQEDSLLLSIFDDFIYHFLSVPFCRFNLITVSHPLPKCMKSCFLSSDSFHVFPF